MIDDQFRFFGDGGAAKKESRILGVGYRNPDDPNYRYHQVGQLTRTGQYATDI